MKTITAIADEDLEPGEFVTVDPSGHARADATLRGRGGQVKSYIRVPRCGEFEVLTDGGALSRLTGNGSISVHGQTFRFAKGETLHLKLKDGRVVGFEGDDRRAGVRAAPRCECGREYPAELIQGGN